MLGGMRRDRCGKEENQGNYCCKIERDARCHYPQLHNQGDQPAGLVWIYLLRGNQYIASRSYCTYNIGGVHYH